MLARSIFAVLSRVIITLCSFLIIPLLINHYGTSEFGRYIAFTVFWGFLNTIDFGVGAAIIGEGVRGEKKNFSLIEIFLSTLFNIYKKWKYLFFIGFPIALFLLEHNSNVFKIITVILYLVYAPVNIALTCTVNSLLSRDRQNTYLLINSLNPIFHFVLIFWCLKFSIAVDLLLLLLPISQSLLSLLFVLLNLRLKSVKNINIQLSEGEKNYFKIGLLTYVSYNVDVIIISRLLDSEGVATFSLYQKIFFTPGAVLGAVSVLVWGRIAQQRSDRVYTHLFTRYIWPFSTAAAFICFFLATMLFANLSSGQITFNYLTGLIFSLWTILHIYNAFASSIVNGKELQAKYVPTLFYITLLNFVLSVALTPLIQIDGPILASVISMAIFIRHLSRLIHEN